MIGIAIKKMIAIGDALQFSSVPENYFAATGAKLLDMDHPWFFDNNPYVVRAAMEPERVQQMWNFCPNQFEWPEPRKHGVYLSNAEIWASVFKVPVVLNRPRLYTFENYPYAQRSRILLQTTGRSHGVMPKHIIDHVSIKYRDCDIKVIGPYDGNQFTRLETPTLWHLAEEISKAKMVICLDSGPAWIAACYPDVVCKKVRTRPMPDILETWVPLECRNIHSHWDDRCHQIFNPTEKDIGFTWSYKRI